MNLNPWVQIVLVGLLLLAAAAAVYGPTAYLWGTLILSMLAGLLVGLVQHGFPGGLGPGLVYGLVISFIFGIAGGFTRYLRKQGDRAMKEIKRSRAQANQKKQDSVKRVD